MENAVVPRILKPGLKDRLLTAIAKGATYRLACGYAGIAYQTLRVWIKKGEPLLLLHEEEIEKHPDKIYFDFLCDLRRIESYAAMKWLDKIDEASNIHWQAAAWKLERRHPKDYGRYEKEAAQDKEDDSIKKAREEVLKLQSDNHGRSEAAKEGSSL